MQIHHYASTVHIVECLYTVCTVYVYMNLYCAGTVYTWFVYDEQILYTRGLFMMDRYCL